MGQLKRMDARTLYTKDGRLGRGQLTCLNFTYVHTKTNKQKYILLLLLL